MTTPADNGAELNQDLPAISDNEITVAELTGDEQNAYAEPPDAPLAVDDFGTTPQEEYDGESLDGRLARELPDVGADRDVPEGYGQGNLPGDDPGEGDPGEGDGTGNGLDDDLVGRLVEPDEGARGDDVAELVGTDYGADGGGFTAEEAAMHIDPDS